MCVSSSRLPSDYICQRHTSLWFYSTTLQALQHPSMCYLLSQLREKGHTDRDFQESYKTRSSANTETKANLSHQHMNDRLIKNACTHGGSSTVLYIAYQVQSALALNQEEKNLNPKEKSFSWAIFAKKHKSMQRIRVQSTLIPQIYNSD